MLDSYGNAKHLFDANLKDGENNIQMRVNQNQGNR